MAFDVPASTTSEKLKAGIISLCEQNKCEISGRVRLSAFRGNGGLHDGDNTLQYLVECAQVDDSARRLNLNGLVIDVYPGARKTGDSFSNLKSANFLPYTMAARYAKQNNWDDCLVLNTSGRIADATIANIFLVKDGRLTTPALTEGCVSGVMRRWLIETYPVHEAALAVEDLLSADELLLTNAVQGIKWVKQFRTKTFAYTMAAKIHNELVTSLWT